MQAVHTDPEGFLPQRIFLFRHEMSVAEESDASSRYLYKKMSACARANLVKIDRMSRKYGRTVLPHKDLAVSLEFGDEEMDRDVKG